MGFEHRSYGGKLFRPSPQVHFDDGEQGLCIVATPWGESDATEQVVQTMVDYFMSAMDDFEATSPFEKLSCLSMTANHLRIACLIANDFLYREINKSEYQLGLEIFAAASFDNEFVFVQLGFPQVLLHRPSRGIASIGTNIDLSFDLSLEDELLPPLPSQLMGLDPTCHIAVNSLRPQEGDKLLLVSRSQVPSSIFNASEFSLDSASRLLAKDQVDMPFWLGLYSF